MNGLFDKINSLSYISEAPLDTSDRHDVSCRVLSLGWWQTMVTPELGSQLLNAEEIWWRDISGGGE